jgi:hypothetical protein
MNRPHIPNLEAALQYARSPASVVAGRFESPPKLNHLGSLPGDADVRTLLGYVLQANALREQMQRQTARAVAVLAGQENLNWARLSGQARDHVPRKPRIALWVAVNGRATLEVIACPEIDPGPHLHCLTRETLAARTDYVELNPTWPYYGAHPQVVFRALEDEYVDRTGEDDTRVGRREGRGILKDALSEGLSYLVTTLGSVCDVRVGNWPEYTEAGQLNLGTPEDRAAAAMREQLPALEQRRCNLEALIAEKVSKHKLASVAEFEEMETQAARDGAKITALIFAKTGQRCSSIGTDKISALVAEHRDLVQRLAEFERAMLTLRWPGSARYDGAELEELKKAMMAQGRL